MSTIRILKIAAMMLALGSCATGPRPIPRHCGVGYSWDHEKENGSPIPACALPAPKQIAEACGYAALSNDATVVYVPAPGYQVSNLRCRYARGDRSKARCSFAIRQLAGDHDDRRDRPITPWRPAHAGFTYRYSISGDGEGHVVSGLGWDADAKCRPAGPRGELL